MGWNGAQHTPGNSTPSSNSYVFDASVGPEDPSSLSQLYKSAAVLDGADWSTIELKNREVFLLDDFSLLVQSRRDNRPIPPRRGEPVNGSTSKLRNVSRIAI